MPTNNQTYRIRTVVGTNSPDYTNELKIHISQKYDTFEIMSMKISSNDSYRLHNADYGVVAGRVIANNGFGIPNAKISIFFAADDNDDIEMKYLYPYYSTSTTNDSGVRYNLLPDNKVDDCHQVVGTFPNKSYLLENDVLVEVYDKYYRYSTKTNNSGDYMICGIPTGRYTIHMDLDLSDCGMLSQRPRDFVYKGYTIEQFENPNQFKKDTNLSTLSQIFTQDTIVNVNPFWGNSELGETIGITRADFNIPFKFESTCVFMGSIVSDNSSNGITKNCIPTNQMGQMDELTSGEGRIEMIRKTYSGDVESFQINGTQLINGDGVWCYQIPMNLDYVMTDEYGNLVPTDDPEKGIATRARVRFRISMQDMDGNTDMYYKAKVLVPHNPGYTEKGHEDYDYNFGTFTRDESFRDLFWNNVYTVKSYIPRISKSSRWKSEKFTGIKGCNHYGNNNPLPYNNIRIKLPLMFTLLCALIKSYIWIVGFLNYVNAAIIDFIFNVDLFGFAKYNLKDKAKLTVIKDGLCPDLDGWYFAPILDHSKNNGDYIWQYKNPKCDLLENTYNALKNNENTKYVDDKESIDYTNSDSENASFCLTINVDFLIQCVEMALAEEYRVINFDFYNDWLNGVVYIPRWMRTIKQKRLYWIFGPKIGKIKGCMDDTSIFGKTRRYMQLCSLRYRPIVDTSLNTKKYSKAELIRSNKFHKNDGKISVNIFGSKRGGIVHEEKTMKNQNVYYLKPCEWTSNSENARRATFFATDIVLLGSLNECDMNGTPNIFKYLSGTSYKLPSNLALTNMETDGPLYAGDSKTICGSNTNSVTKGISPIDGNSLEAEIKYYNSLDENGNTIGSTKEPVTFNDDSGELSESDTIAITEAAGISWDYTGPYQGNPNKNKIYNPGGHFLGMSCVNSETNIKTCVNLSRICELGVTMSQRREEIFKIKYFEESDETEYKYKYNVPTGLIANNEIIAPDARAIFATMNSFPLIAKIENPKTGYLYYDMINRYPDTFNGELYDMVNGYKDGYNYKIPIVKNEDLTKYGVKPGTDRSDYDSAEILNTQRQTYEEGDVDYHLFRFGLSYKDLLLENANKMQKRRFLYWKSSETMMLPQFENSFYFYFGLKAGATALDEFNKQFFAECESVNAIPKIDDIRISTETDVCSGKSEITLNLSAIEKPCIIDVYKYVPIATGSGGTYFKIKDLSQTDYNDDIYKFSVVFNQYKINVTSPTGKIYTKTIKVGENVASANITVFNFNTVKYDTRNVWWRGGYIQINNLLIDNLLPFNFEYVKIEVDEEEYEYTDNIQCYVKKPGTYRLKVKYKCSDYSEVSLSVGEFMITGPESVELFMGPNKEISVYTTNNITGLDLKSNKWYKDGWWENISGSEDLKWRVKHSIIQQNGSIENEYPFNSNVNANGDKALFGFAQNQDEWFKNAVYSSYDITGGFIEPGYALTDTTQYKKTITINDKVMSFGAMAYSEKGVGGDVCAVIEDVTGATANVSVINSDMFNSIKGLGCVAKSIDGLIEIFKVDNGGRIIFNEKKITPYRGIIYPLFRYPSIYRPFYADNAYFIINKKILGTQVETTGNENVTIVYDTSTSKMEGIVYNGITYNGSLGDSNINRNIKEIRPKQDDLYDYKSSYRKSEYGMEGDVITGNTSETVTFSFSEGTPTGNEEGYSITYETQPKIFYESVYYADKNGQSVFKGEGKSNEGIQYFIIPNTIVTYPNEALVYKKDENVAYVGCSYAEGSQKGKFVVGKLENGMFTISLTDEEGKETVKSYEMNVSYDDLSGIYNSVNSVMANDNIICEKKATINIEKSWYKNIIDNITNENYRQITINSGVAYDFNPNTDLLVGYYNTYATDNIGGIQIVNVYTDLAKTSLSDDMNIYINATPLVITSGKDGGNYQMQIQSNASWSLSVNSDWISTNVTQGTGNSIVNVTVSALPEEGGSEGETLATEREGNINIRTSDGSRYVDVIIRQNK